MTEFTKLIRVHWKALGLILAVVLALVSGVYAYTRFNGSPLQPPSTSTLSLYPVELRMELSKTEFAVGEPIEIRLYLKNISNRTIVASFNSGKVFDFNVTDINGAPVFILSQNVLYTQAGLTQLLYSGEALNRTFIWNQTYGSRAFKDKYQQQIPVGTYYIEGLTAESMFVSYWDGQTVIEPFMPYRGEPTGVEGEQRTPKVTIAIG